MNRGKAPLAGAHIRGGVMAWLLLAMLLCTALSETTAPVEEWYTAEQVEEARECLPIALRALAGVDFTAEERDWKQLAPEALLSRQEAMAQYRDKVAPLLWEAFALDDGRLTPCQTALPAEETLLEEIPPKEDILAMSYAALSDTEAGRALLALGAEKGATDGPGLAALMQKWAGAWAYALPAETLLSQNPHYALWLYMADTPIDYPVVQGEDNSYYLRRLLDGRSNSCGTLFIDYRNLPKLQDPNTLVYGHHMRNGSMFGMLTRYEQPGFFESHPYLLVVTPDTVYLGQVVAGYTTGSDDHCYDIAISGEEDYRAFVEEALAKSDFVSGVDCAPGETLMTLSTCAYRFRNARYILLCKLTPVSQRVAEEEQP